jgi:hypothetical protein
MSKHTSGPWRADYRGESGFNGEHEWWITLEDDDCHSVAVVRHGADDPEYGGHPVLKANAHLVAAAPEMFEALLSARSLLSAIAETFPNSEHVRMTREQIKAAIEKAASG